MADSGGPEKPLAGASSGSKVEAGSKKIPAPPREIPSFLKPLQFMGVPKAVLTWKPRLPSRNWTIFFTVTGGLTSMYIYDRRQCKAIQQEYKDRVRSLAEEPMLPSEHPRKIIVYAAKSPGDDDYEKSLLYFKKYVKPILVAAAIDWETLNGTRHGGLARQIRERIYSRRRQLLNLEPWGTPPSSISSSLPDPLLQGVLPFSLLPQEQLEREINGAVVLVGRPALKEWAWGLKAGWTTTLPPARQDLDESLARELSEDSVFDEVEQDNSLSIEDNTAEADGAGAPLPSRIPSSSPISYNPAFQMAGSAQSQQTKPAESAAPTVDPRLLEPPSQIPAQPPLCFVDYTNLTGFKNVPRKLYGFFNEREKVRRGGQAALAIALGDKSNAREINVATTADGEVERTTPPQGGDLDWGLESESFYHGRFAKTQSDIESARKSFYDGLPKRLEETRTYVRGQRELRVTEKNDPPKTEGQLRTDRFENEKDWRNLTMGFNILKPESGVEWHRAFIGSLRVLRERHLKDEENNQAALG